MGRLVRVKAAPKSDGRAHREGATAVAAGRWEDRLMFRVRCWTRLLASTIDAMDAVDFERIDATCPGHCAGFRRQRIDGIIVVEDKNRAMHT